MVVAVLARLAVSTFAALALLLIRGLEPPWVEAATYTVTVTTNENNTCDSSCSLREAILAANANSSTDTVAFNIPGASPRTITPGTGYSIAARCRIPPHLRRG
jgi:CSLREA domain-containing protein